MKLAIMQPYILPYIRYFQLINAVDKFVIFDDVNFMKKGRVNRNHLLLNKKAHLFTIPLSRASQNRRISATEIFEPLFWQSRLINTITRAYRKAPYFEEIFPMIENIILSKAEKISEYSANSIMQICNYLNIETEIIPSSSVYENTELNGQERVLDICKKERANVYVNLPGGKVLYDQAFFSRNNVELKFLESTMPQYVQYQHEFVPNLSILDVLMFNSKLKVIDFINDFRLS